MKRGSGVLMHISSLPGDYGIGTMGKEAFQFIDFLYQCKQQYWQVLPLGPTGYGDSPYQAFSSFAGNPYLIDLENLVQEGLLTKNDIEASPIHNTKEKVDYSVMFLSKMKLLKKAFLKGRQILNVEIEKFKLENHWIEDYSLFMALKVHFHYEPWVNWEDSIKFRTSIAIKKYTELLSDAMEFWDFIQYTFYQQWHSVKEYANNKGIQIIGDIPFYVPEDSVETWVDKDLFLLDEKGFPHRVSGVPGDRFSEDGQLWGTPVYRWDAMRRDGYQWWIRRIEGSRKLFDILRLDHFIGFYSYWSIPYGLQAKDGNWEKGPSIELFDKVKAALGEISFIAENLGPPIKGIKDFLEETGFPGMNILLFAFDSDSRSPHLPQNYKQNSVVYTGTHDNSTVVEWFNSTDIVKRSAAIYYLNLNQKEGYYWGFLRAAWSSRSQIAIAPMQDILGLGAEARMNIPSTTEGNWQWRLSSHQVYGEVVEKLKELTLRYNRASVQHLRLKS